jgi:pyruvate/2-oxoglutarate dehydrogenase complex dihydrolipoamide dehydrogenase (E3) component
LKQKRSKIPRRASLRHARLSAGSPFVESRRAGIDPGSNCSYPLTSMPETKGLGLYNVVVIGAGTAGLVTAAGTVGLGGRVALIERNKMGGDCLNYGCVPSKALIASARAVDRIRHASRWGLDEQEPRFEFENVFESMRSRRAKIAPHDSVERFESLGVDIFSGEASFVSPYEIAVDGQSLRAKNFVIAAGTRAGIPPIEGIRGVPFFTNETIFDELRNKPDSMIVLGGGPIGCELSQAMSRLGVKVTIIEVLEQILPKEDRDVADWMETMLTTEGIRVLRSSQATRVSMRDGKVQFDLLRRPRGAYESEPIQIVADTLLVSAGRVPNVEKLNLEAAGVKSNSRGIEVNAYLQTSQPHIYAAGDIVGPYQFTHTADAQARVVVRNILMPFQFLRQKMDYSVVPWCTYTDPEIARVGLNETEAKQQNTAYDLICVRINELDRSVVEREELGFIRVLIAKGTDKILGVTIVAVHAGDLLHEFVLAMRHRIGLAQLATTIHPYPTFAELARKIGDHYNKKRLTPLVKKVFGWLYKRARADSARVQDGLNVKPEESEGGQEEV